MLINVAEPRQFETTKQSLVVNQLDTTYLLTNNTIKYWDRVKDSSSLTKSKFLACWSINERTKSILEYNYDEDKPKLRYEAVHADLVFGKIPFTISKDTLILLFPGSPSKCIIKKLTPEMLILNEVSGGFIGPNAVFIRSSDQKRKVIPFFVHSR